MNVYRYRVEVSEGPENDPWKDVLEITASSRAEADYKLEQRLQEVGRYVAALLGVRQIVTREIPPDPRLELLRELEKTAEEVRTDESHLLDTRTSAASLQGIIQTTRERLEREAAQ